jgi:hypothetical protein
MNNRGLVKYMFLVFATIISLYFIINMHGSMGVSHFYLVLILNFVLVSTMLMYVNKDKIKINKFIYDVILILLMIFSTIWFIYPFYTGITCFFAYNCTIEFKEALIIPYTLLLFISLVFNFRDLFNMSNKTNDILTIIVSMIIIIIHLRYYLEPNFLHRLVEGELYIGHSYDYVTQNYIYFIMMVLIVLLHHKVNKVT